MFFLCSFGISFDITGDSRQMQTSSHLSARLWYTYLDVYSFTRFGVITVCWTGGYT